jgi:hypothetical protein
MRRRRRWRGPGWSHIVQQDRELVATETRHGVVGSRTVRRCARPPSFSSSSPTRWPTLSLTTLKRSRSRNSTANRATRRGGSAITRMRQAVEQEGAVGQAGQGVVQRLVLEPQFDPLALDDLVGQLAIGHRQFMGAFRDAAFQVGIGGAQAESCARLRSSPLAMW